MSESVAEIKQTVTVDDGQVVVSKNETKRLGQDSSHQMNNEGRARVTTETQVDLVEKVVVTNDTLIGWPIRLSSVNVHEREEQQVISLDNARQTASPTKPNAESGNKPADVSDNTVQPALSMSLQVGSVFNQQLRSGTNFNIQTRLELRSMSPEYNFMVQNVVGSFTFTTDPEGPELPAPSAPSNEPADQMQSQAQSAINSVAKTHETEDSRTEISQSEHVVSENKLETRTTENVENQHMDGIQIEQVEMKSKSTDLTLKDEMNELPTKTDPQHSGVAEGACPSLQAELIGGQATVCDEQPQQLIQAHHESVCPPDVMVDHIPVSKSEENIELKLGQIASTQSYESDLPMSKSKEITQRVTQADNVDQQEPVADISHATEAEHNSLVNLTSTCDDKKADSLVVLAKSAEENKAANESEIEGIVKSEKSFTKDTSTIVESYPKDQIEEKPKSVSHSVLNVVDTGEETAVPTGVDPDEQLAEQSVKSPMTETLQQPIAATSPEVLDVPEDEKQRMIQSPASTQSEEPEMHHSKQCSEEGVLGTSNSEEQLYHQVARRITNEVLQKSQQQTLQQSEQSITEHEDVTAKQTLESIKVAVPDNPTPSTDLRSTTVPVLAVQKNQWSGGEPGPIPETLPTKTTSEVNSSRQSPVLRDAQVNTGRELSPETDDEVNNESEWSHSMHHYRHHHRHYRSGSGGERTHPNGFSPPCCAARREAQRNRDVCHFSHGRSKSPRPKRLSRSCTQQRGQEMVLCNCGHCCGLAIPYEVGAAPRVAEDHSDDTSSPTQTASETSEMQRMTMTLLNTIATTAELLRKQYKRRKLQNVKATDKCSKRMQKEESAKESESAEVQGVQNTSCAEPYSCQDSVIRYPEFVQNFRITIPAELLSIKKDKKGMNRVGSSREHGVQCELPTKSQRLRDASFELENRSNYVNNTQLTNAYERTEQVKRAQLSDCKRKGRYISEVGIDRKLPVESTAQNIHAASCSSLTYTVQEIAEEELSQMLTTVNCCVDAIQNSRVDGKSNEPCCAASIGKRKSPVAVPSIVAFGDLGKMSSENLLQYEMEARSPPVTPSVAIDYLCTSKSETPSYDTSYTTQSIQSKQCAADRCILGTHENELSRRRWAPVSNSAYLWCASECTGKGHNGQMISAQFSEVQFYTISPQEYARTNPPDECKTPQNNYLQHVSSDRMSVRGGKKQCTSSQHAANVITDTVISTNKFDSSDPHRAQEENTPMTISLSMQANWTKRGIEEREYNRVTEFDQCSEMHDLAQSSSVITVCDQQPSDKETSNSWAALTTDTADLIRKTVQCRLHL